MAALRLPTYHEHHSRLVVILVVLWFVITGLAFLLYFFGPPFLPLWYTLVEPAEQLAPNLFILTIPLLALAILVVSMWYGRRSDLDHEDFLAANALWSGSALLVLLLIALIRIIKIII